MRVNLEGQLRPATIRCQYWPGGATPRNPPQRAAVLAVVSRDQRGPTGPSRTRDRGCAARIAVMSLVGGFGPASAGADGYVQRDSQRGGAGHGGAHQVADLV